MKLFIKILLFVLVELVANVNVTSAAITFSNIQEVTTSLSFHTEIVAKTIFKISENDLANCCQNGNDLVDYKDWVTSIEAVAAKGGFDAVGAFKNAISPFKGGNLTNAGRAVTKHPGYFGFESTEALMGAYRTPGALNNLGSTTLKDILRNGVRTTGAGGRYLNGWTTYTLPNGNAASWGIRRNFHRL